MMFMKNPAQLCAGVRTNKRRRYEMTRTLNRIPIYGLKRCMHKLLEEKNKEEICCERAPGVLGLYMRKRPISMITHPFCFIISIRELYAGRSLPDFRIEKN